MKLVKFPAFRPYTRARVYPRAYGANVSKFTNFTTRRRLTTAPPETGGKQHAMPCHDACAGARKRVYLRGDAAFANPEMREFLEVERIGYAIRLPANSVLQRRSGYLLKRPVGRPPHEMRRYIFHRNP